jgi:hypothetical protein
MGLISPEEFRECEAIRKIRNEFAHKMNVPYSGEPIRSLCATMRYSVPGEKSPRGQFTSAAVVMVMRLTNRAHYVAQKRLSHIDWEI